jgi:hypothetical protein
MKKPEKHNDFNIISETTETALTVDMKDELAKSLEGYARDAIPEKEERVLIRDMYIGWAVRDILKKTLKELKCARTDDSYESSGPGSDSKSILKEVRRLRPLRGELDFKTDCHFPACRAITKQVNHNFCVLHHRYFNRIHRYD